MDGSTRSPEWKRNVSALVRQGLTVLLMLFVSALAGVLPGSDIVLFRGLAIAALLRLTLAVAMAAVLLAVRREAAELLREYLGEIFPRAAEDAALGAAAAKTALHGTRLVYVCLVYGIVMHALAPVAGALVSAAWPLAAVRLAALALAVAALVGVLTGAHRLFDEAGRAIAAGNATEAEATAKSEPEPAAMKCAGCGVLNDDGSRFCRFCGHALEAVAVAPAAPPAGQPCARCGATVVPPSRFCSACGKPS